MSQGISGNTTGHIHIEGVPGAIAPLLTPAPSTEHSVHPMSLAQIQSYLYNRYHISLGTCPLTPMPPIAQRELPASLVTHTVAGIRNERRARHRTAGRIAAKSALEMFTNWRFGANDPIVNLPTGQPVFKNHPHIHLSISHTDTIALACVGQAPAGIDIEKNETRPPSFVRYFMSSAEQDWISHSGMDTVSAVNVLWTRKEAISKLLGKGSILPFKSVSVIDALSPYRLHSFLDGTHVISIAIFSQEMPK
ncbi:MAG: 4'-phosphopantetheinyl transferase superfamily protein [Deltaproteobacteria bacterium]|nr:4'-phosphopantetheinyl transferase superfamily protein [Deltaproteobacteria bacterium]